MSWTAKSSSCLFSPLHSKHRNSSLKYSPAPDLVGSCGKEVRYKEKPSDKMHPAAKVGPRPGSQLL